MANHSGTSLSPYEPGTRFVVWQDSKRRWLTRERPRRYRVQLFIDMAGDVKWIGGVKARPETLAKVREHVAESRRAAARMGVS